MSKTSVDPRRATAERNAEAILDAASDLIARGAPLNMAAIAAGAGVSRPTLYSHYPRLADVMIAAVDRAVAQSMALMDAAEPERGPAPEALRRVLDVSWTVLAQHEAMARAASEQLSAERVNERHHPLMARLHTLVLRGQREGDFRSDRDPKWLVAAFFALIHSAAELGRDGELEREVAHEQLARSVADVFLTAR